MARTAMSSIRVNPDRLLQLPLIIGNGQLKRRRTQNKNLIDLALA